MLRCLISTKLVNALARKATVILKIFGINWMSYCCFFPSNPNYPSDSMIEDNSLLLKRAVALMVLAGGLLSLSSIRVEMTESPFYVTSWFIHHFHLMVKNITINQLFNMQVSFQTTINTTNFMEQMI